MSQEDKVKEILKLQNKGKISNNTYVSESGGRKIDFNSYLNRLEGIENEYENIRNDYSDISKISVNTGIPKWKIQRIKEHVFFNKHKSDSIIARFDADPEIADTWYRLIEGKFNNNDIDLLNHKYFESKFESYYKTDYRTAHNKTVNSGRI